jgi:hypothetical protein
LGEVGDDARGLLQGADGEESGIGDEATAVEGQVQLLCADVPEGKVRIGLRDHEPEPPQWSKLLGKHSLDTARGSPFNDPVRDPG